MTNGQLEGTVFNHASIMTLLYVLLLCSSLLIIQLLERVIVPSTACSAFANFRGNKMIKDEIIIYSSLNEQTIVVNVVLLDHLSKLVGFLRIVEGVDAHNLIPGPLLMLA